VRPRDLLLCAEVECEEVWLAAERLSCPRCGSTSALPLSRLTGERKVDHLKPKIRLVKAGHRKPA
jgi:hypothetical protein